MRSHIIREQLPDGTTRVTVQDPRETDGDLLWPSRFPEPEVVKLENSLLSYADAQLQQNPVSREGGIFKTEWLRYWSPGGRIADTVALPPFGTNLQSWDCSFKGKDSSDPTCGGLWRRAAGRFYLLDCEWGRWDFPGAKEAVKRLCERWPKVFHKLVEDKANGPAIVSSLMEEYPGFEQVDPEGGKESRANAVAPLFKAGLVFLPHPTLFPWVKQAVQELTRFPRGAHDDFVDQTSQALVHMASKNKLVDAMTELKKR